MDKQKEKTRKRMSDRRIWVSVQQTIQPKPYCPLQICVGMSADIEDGQKASAEYEKIFKQLNDQIKSGFEIIE